MLLIFSLNKLVKTNVAYFFSLNKLVKTMQHSQATTIENLKSETSHQITMLLIKQTECMGIVHPPI